MFLLCHIDCYFAWPMEGMRMVPIDSVGPDTGAGRNYGESSGQILLVVLAHLRREGMTKRDLATSSAERWLQLQTSYRWYSRSPGRYCTADAKLSALEGMLHPAEALKEQDDVEHLPGPFRWRRLCCASCSVPSQGRARSLGQRGPLQQKLLERVPCWPPFWFSAVHHVR